MNNQEKLFRTGSLVGVILFVFLALLSVKELISLQYIGKDVPVMNSITVNGKGETISIPDIATFSFGVTETAKTVNEAKTKATDKIANALKAVRVGGVAENDIQTLSYNINPHYEYIQPTCIQGLCPSGKNVLTGYDVSQTISVKVRDLSKAGDLFDSISSAGVQNIDSLTFSIDKIDAVRAMAQGAAIADAKAKAQKIADNLGVKLVRITGFYDQSNEVVMNSRMDNLAVPMSAKVGSSAPEIPKGEQKVTSNVSVTYEIR